MVTTFHLLHILPEPKWAKKIDFQDSEYPLLLNLERQPW